METSDSSQELSGFGSLPRPCKKVDIIVLLKMTHTVWIFRRLIFFFFMCSFGLLRSLHHLTTQLFISSFIGFFAVWVP